AAQFAQAQFHCGRPPPAALPRMWMRINPEFSESDNYVRSNCTRVTGALEKDRNAFHHRFDPTLLCSSHKSQPAFISHFVIRKQWNEVRASHKACGLSRSNYFLIKLMSPLRSMRARRICDTSPRRASRRISSSKSWVEMWLRRIVSKSHWPSRTM